VSSVQSGEGAIGYADASQAGKLGIAKIGVGSEFVAPSPEGEAAVVENSELQTGRGEHDLAYDVNRTTESADEYPVVLVSYLIGCVQYDNKDTAALVKGFVSYVVSEEGQKAAADAAGSAPLSSGLTDKVGQAVAAVGAA